MLESLPHSICQPTQLLSTHNSHLLSCASKPLKCLSSPPSSTTPSTRSTTESDRVAGEVRVKHSSALAPIPSQHFQPHVPLPKLCNCRISHRSTERQINTSPLPTSTKTHPLKQSPTTKPLPRTPHTHNAPNRTVPRQLAPATAMAVVAAAPTTPTTKTAASGAAPAASRSRTHAPTRARRALRARSGRGSTRTSTKAIAD